MAIDTAEKRRAVAAFALLFLAPGVAPDAAKDAEWRQEALWSYPGIAAAAPTVVPPCFAGATIHPAHLRLVTQARLRGVVSAHLRREA